MDLAGQVQHLHEMINLAHGVLLEAQNLNLKQPLQSNASLFTFADMDVTPSSPSVGDVSMLDEKDDEPTTLATLTGDEIQDSFTKLAALKSAYIKHSSELLESLQQKKEDVANDNLLARRDALRKHDVVEWLENAMDRTFPTHDLQELLKSGIVLRELLTSSTYLERSLDRLGMSECSLFGTDDLYEGTNMVQVVFGMQYIKAWFSGGVRSPRSPKNAPVGVWSFSESQHKSQECLLQGAHARTMHHAYM
ncbi:hypothetical protein DYB32_007874 [Aphanomyces invadans]|uniref:Calponin-homology (CH) domain-containing protein n=1 Tax=Aphanomyces invadans TaxID=157072 RepID=A0A418AN97_9STRA|nr:hypothetical protein DYB32_007874 [Aphanomyces invadans]